jgi:hypothetical protein
MERYVWTLAAVLAACVFWVLWLGLSALWHFHQINRRPEDGQ